MQARSPQIISETSFLLGSEIVNVHSIRTERLAL